MKLWALVMVVVIAVVAVGGLLWQTYDISQHTPKLCTSCHLMQGAYDTWSHSAHKDTDCHTCHRASVAEQNRYLVNTVLKRPQEVPPRNGRVIVPRTICLECHWEGPAEIAKVNASAGHAVHAFNREIQCTVCHAQQVHQFKPDPTVCGKCHAQTVKTPGMEKHDCQLCHNWKAAPASAASTGLLPGRATCLGCHASSKTTHFPEKAPMKFECSTCHQPHQEQQLGARDCLKCHQAAARSGQHPVHLESAGLTCNDCHRPHTWKVTESRAKVDCARCHDYRPPSSFLAAAPAPGFPAAHEVTGQ